MGAQIAAHLANAGVPVVLLDLTPDAARTGLARAKALKPDPFFTRDAAALITTGGFDTDFERLASCDLIVEAIVERLDIKRALVERIDAVRRADAIVTTNTSGIPIAAIAEGRSDGFRLHWLGTHFFNPPRYLKLLEVIPTPDTLPDVVERVTTFADRRLGKGVVVAKDSPNFIANHVGLFSLMRILDVFATGEYSIEEIDAMTGPAIGRPKSATFRTLDLSGVDLLIHVTNNLLERLAPERHQYFKLPLIIAELVSRGWVGEKAGQGFYKRVRGADGSDILTLDPSTFEYRPRQSVKLPVLDAVRSIESATERMRTLFTDQGRVGAFLRATLAPTIVYAAEIAPEIAHSLDDVDRAMRWGFAWDMGPFEAGDAIGLQQVVDAAKIDPLPALVRQRQAEGQNAFRGRALPTPAGLLLFSTVRDAPSIVKQTAGASLVDLGDGVLGVELHSKMNTIGGDTIAMLNAGVKEAERNFRALVVATDAPDFSLGANLMLLLLEAQEGNWEEIDLMVRAFQQATMGLKGAGVPVVVAPAGRTLGGGTEIALHGDRIQAAAETYMGLVEVGVGLIPGGGGTKEMIVRSSEHLLVSPHMELLPGLQRAFETIGYAKVSTSGAEARTLGFLRDTDRLSANRDRLIADAKALALARAQEGYQPAAPRRDIPVGGESVEAAFKVGLHLAHRAGHVSDYDLVIGRTLAHILAGGNLPHRALVGEQYLLDLEREAFLSLCGQRKTLERIQHTLKTGKPLRN